MADQPTPRAPEPVVSIGRVWLPSADTDMVVTALLADGGAVLTSDQGSVMVVPAVVVAKWNAAPEPSALDDHLPDKIGRALERHFGGFLAHDPHKPDVFWGLAADAVMDVLRRNGLVKP